VPVLIDRFSSFFIRFFRFVRGVRRELSACLLRQAELFIHLGDSVVPKRDSDAFRS